MRSSAPTSPVPAATTTERTPAPLAQPGLSLSLVSLAILFPDGASPPAVELPLDIHYCEMTMYETPRDHVQCPTQKNPTWDVVKFKVCGHWEQGWRRARTTAKGGTTMVWGDNVDLAWVPRVLGQDPRRLSLCLHRKGEVGELDLRWPSECRVYINHDESWVVSGGVARWVKNMVSGTLFV